MEVPISKQKELKKNKSSGLPKLEKRKREKFLKSFPQYARGADGNRILIDTNPELSKKFNTLASLSYPKYHNNREEYEENFALLKVVLNQELFIFNNISRKILHTKHSEMNLGKYLSWENVQENDPEYLELQVMYPKDFELKSLKDFVLFLSDVIYKKFELGIITNFDQVSFTKDYSKGVEYRIKKNFELFTPESIEDSRLLEQKKLKKTIINLDLLWFDTAEAIKLIQSLPSFKPVYKEFLDYQIEIAKKELEIEKSTFLKIVFGESLQGKEYKNLVSLHLSIVKFAEDLINLD